MHDEKVHMPKNWVSIEQIVWSSAADNVTQAEIMFMDEVLGCKCPCRGIKSYYISVLYYHPFIPRALTIVDPPWTMLKYNLNLPRLTLAASSFVL